MHCNFKKETPYFVFDPEGDGMEYFDTEEDRDKAASKAIEKYIDTDGWDPEVVHVTVGVVTHSAQKCDIQERPTEEEFDEDGCDNDGVYWDSDCMYICNYKMLPILESLT